MGTFTIRLVPVATLSNEAGRDYQNLLLQVKSIGELATDTVTLTHEINGQEVEIMPDMSREVARESGALATPSFICGPGTYVANPFRKSGSTLKLKDRI